LWVRVVWGLREALIQAFPAPDLRREAAFSFANLCASAGGSQEVLMKAALPECWGPQWWQGAQRGRGPQWSSENRRFSELTGFALSKSKLAIPSASSRIVSLDFALLIVCVDIIPCPQADTVPPADGHSAGIIPVGIIAYSWKILGVKLLVFI